MITAICPYCEVGVSVVLDNIFHDLIDNKETTCLCTKCNHTFIIFLKNNKLESKYDNSTCVSIIK